MKINLGLKKETVIKKFSFSVDDPYEEEVIGKDSYNETGITLLPNFVGQNKSVATTFGAKHGLKINISYVDSASKKDLIISQSVPADADLDALDKNKGITVKVSNGSKNSSSNNNSNVSDEVDCSLKANRDDTKNCSVPSFINKKYSSFTNWYKYNKQYDIDYDASSCKNSTDMIISQTGVSGGSSIYDWIHDGKKLTITCSSDDTDDTTKEEE